MKKIIILVLAISMLLFTSCNKYEIPDSTKADSNSFPDYQYNQEKVQGHSGATKIAVADNGYYHIINNTLYFYNISSDINLPMCSKSKCEHNSKDCDAYVKGTDTRTGTFECNCMGEKVMYYNNHIYCVEVTKDRDYYLYQYDSSFNNKTKVARLASVKDDNTSVTGAQVCMISNGYLYFYITYIDSDYVKNDYVALFKPCRIELKENSSVETLGEFHFPGDYAFEAGNNNGFGIYLSNDNIYFYAGGTARFYGKYDNVRYYVAKYNPNDKQYSDLWSYKGDSKADVFANNIGYVNSSSSGDYVCMDDYGYFYIPMSSNGSSTDTNSIVKVNFEKKSCDVIYTTSLESLFSIKYDKDTLYFFESQSGTDAKALLTAVDLNGAVKAQYELQFDEHILSINQGSIDISGSDIAIYGMDDRYILIATDAGKFKGLSSNITANVVENISVTAVGVINKQDYLSGNNVSKKQIYEYTR